MNVEGRAAMMIQEMVHGAIQDIHQDILHSGGDRNPLTVAVVIAGSAP
jgi:hypothetical protein